MTDEIQAEHAIVPAAGLVGAGFHEALEAVGFQREQRDSQRLALDTLGSLDVMISACLPTGERTRFNECFLHFVGRPPAQLRPRW